MIEGLSILVLLILLLTNTNHAVADRFDTDIIVEKHEIEKENEDKEKIHAAPEIDGSLFAQVSGLLGGICLLMNRKNK